MKTLRKFALLPASLAIVCLASLPPTLSAVPRYGDLPLSFERNRGQAPHNVEYLARGNGYALFLNSGEATLTLGDAHVRMKLEGARPAPTATPLTDLGGTVNYLIGGDRSQWRTGIHTYSGIKYENVYRGIDVVYYGKQRQLEYDFIVHPGARPESIRLRFEGAQRLEVDSNGDLVVRLAGAAEPVRFHKPIIYQGKDRIAGGYRLDGRQVRFRVSAYDRSRPLVIDPVVSYSTYLGGAGFDAGYAIAVDSAGSAYITGYTRSLDFPTMKPLRAKGDSSNNKIFIAKLNPAGNGLVYCTYLGGSASDAAFGIAVDKAGNAYLTGTTISLDFPVVKSLQTYGGAPTGTTIGDAFVAKLNPAGDALVYSTFLGGAGSDRGQAIVVDAAGNAYITGSTSSTDFPVQNALQPLKRSLGSTNTAFVTKLNASGSALIFSTYLGGSQSDYGNGIAVDPAGSVVVTGLTYSANFPMIKASQPARGGGPVFGSITSDAFVTKLAADGSSLIYSTYLGGAWLDFGSGVALDASGNAYVTGTTYSSDFPALNARQPALNGVPLYRSLDGGATWSAANSGLIGANITSLVVDPANSLNVYAATSDNGIFISSDSGATWSPSSSGLAAKRVNVLAVSGSSLFAGVDGGLSSDNSFPFPIRRSTDGGATWSASFTGSTSLPYPLVTMIVADPQIPTTLYAGAAGSRVLMKTTDGGDNWTMIDTSIGTGIQNLVVDPKNSSNLYAAAGNGLYKSTDSGVTWTSASSGMTASQPVYSVAIDPKSSTLYAGSFGIVYQSTNAGTTWARMLSAGPISFTSLSVDPSDSSVYAGGYWALFKSIDAGKTWKFAEGVVSPGVNALSVDPKNSSTVYLGVQAPPDMFVTKLDPLGAVVYSTYLGGSQDESAYAIAVDAAGNTHVAGSTCSADFPVASDLALTYSGGCDNSFAIKLDPSGIVAYSTLLGAQAAFDVYGIALDSAGNAYVTGWTGSANMPVSGLQPKYGGGGDAFVMKIKQ